MHLSKNRSAKKEEEKEKEMEKEKEEEEVKWDPTSEYKIYIRSLHDIN